MISPVYERQTQAASQRSCRWKPLEEFKIYKTPRKTSTATRWASRGKHTRLHAALDRSHTHTHTQQATSFFSSPRFIEQSTNALKKQVHKHLKVSRFLTVCTRMPYKRGQHQICEKHSESSDSPQVS